MPKPRKLPPDAEVVRLYVEERMSLCEIANLFGLAQHKSVAAKLQRLGVARRKGSETARQTCVVPGCGRPVFKVVHANNGSPYGTRCEEHRYFHRLKINREIRQRQNNTTEEKKRPSLYLERYPFELVQVMRLGSKLKKEIKDRAKEQAE